MKAVCLFPPGITSPVSAVDGVDDRRGLTLPTSTTNTRLAWTRAKEDQGWPAVCTMPGLQQQSQSGRENRFSAGSMQSLYLTSHSDTSHLSFIAFINVHEDKTI